MLRWCHDWLGGDSTLLKAATRGDNWLLSNGKTGKTNCLLGTPIRGCVCSLTLSFHTENHLGRSTQAWFVSVPFPMELKNGTRNCAPFHGALSKLATLGFEVWGCRKWNHMELKNWIYSPRGLPTKSNMGSKKNGRVRRWISCFFFPSLSWFDMPEMLDGYRIQHQNRGTPSRHRQRFRVHRVSQIKKTAVRGTCLVDIVLSEETERSHLSKFQYYNKSARHQNNRFM